MILNSKYKIDETHYQKPKILVQLLQNAGWYMRTYTHVLYGILRYTKSFIIRLSKFSVGFKIHSFMDFIIKIFRLCDRVLELTCEIAQTLLHMLQVK